MCKPKTPNYEKPPTYAAEKQPDNAALYESAQNRAAERGGGRSRSTIRTSPFGLSMTGRTMSRMGTTVLG